MRDATNSDMTIVEINPSREVTACVILLHGLGADAQDLVPLAAQLGVSPRQGVRFLFPNAPLRPVTINAGQVMRAWYDIYGLSLDQPEDEEGIEAAVASLHSLIEGQIAAGVASPRIVVGGFSQGGAVALYGALRLARRLGGILALSTYLPLSRGFQRERPAADVRTPVMMAHGIDDPVVSCEYGRTSRDRLEDLGFTVTWREYAMGHTLCDQELRDAGRWLNAVLGS